MVELEPFVGKLFDGNGATLPLREKPKSFERLEMKQRCDELNIVTCLRCRVVKRRCGKGGNELEATGQTNGEKK